jgi:hypothetical protein
VGAGRVLEAKPAHESQRAEDDESLHDDLIVGDGCGRIGARNSMDGNRRASKPGLGRSGLASTEMGLIRAEICIESAAARTWAALDF